MENITEFRKELRTLQVMSPERDSAKFVHILKDSSNYQLWRNEFEQFLFSSFQPLGDYFLSEDNAITDFEGNEIATPNIVRQTIHVYNSFLIGALRTSVSLPIRSTIDNYLIRLRTQPEHYAKDVITEVSRKYGSMNLKASFDIFSKYTEANASADIVTITSLTESFVSLTERPDLFKCCAYLKLGSDHTKKEILRKFGTNTEIEFNDFYDNFQSFQQESNTGAQAYYQVIKSKSRKGKKGGKTFCPHCKVFHWKDDCPKKGFSAIEMANLVSERSESKSDEIPESAWIATDVNADKRIDTWYLDSGCTSHIGHNMESFKELELGDGPEVTGLAASVNSQGKGKVEIQNISLSDTLFVPSAPCNLVSISKITSKTKRHVIFTEHGAYLTLLRPDVFKYARKIGVMKHGLYELSVDPPKDVSLWTVDVPSKLVTPVENDFSVSVEGEYGPGNIWHARIGHPGRAVYQTLAKIADLPPLPTTKNPLCPACSLSKGKITKGRMSDSKASAPLELIQVDICGGFRYNDYVDTKYFLTIIDKFSSYYDAIPLKAKSQATIELMNWIRRAENHFANHGGYKVSHVRTDNGGEFVGKILHNSFAERGITHELTVPHSSSQNGAVERAHGVLQTKIRTLLIGGRVPPYLWSEALLCAVYLHNRTPIMGRKGKIPYLYWNDQPKTKINLSHLRVFGCAAYVTLPSTYRDGKLLPTSVTGVMVGYDSHRKGYRIFLPSHKKVITAKDVRFDETYFPLTDTKESHDAYDFATGVLPGVPKYPETNYHSPSKSIVNDFVNDSSISELPCPVSETSTANIGPLATSTSSVTEISSNLSNTSSSSSVILSDHDADPTYIPSRDVPSPPPSPTPNTIPDSPDVSIPDYVPDQSDQIEDNTLALLKVTRQLAQTQQDMQNQLSTLLEQQQTQNTSQLEQLTQIIDSIRTERSNAISTDNIKPFEEPETVPTTPPSPIIETPPSISTPSVSRSSRPLPIVSNVDQVNAIGSPPDSHHLSSLSNAAVPHDLIHSSSNLPWDSTSVYTKSLPLPQPHTPSPTNNSPTTSFSELATTSSESISSTDTNTNKRLHSSLTPNQPSQTSVSPERGALILNPARHKSLLNTTPNPKRQHVANDSSSSTTNEVESAMYGNISYAIGNNPIPIFGLDGMMIPFGSNRDIGVYPLHVRLDKSALPEHAAATALLSQTPTRFIPKTIKQAQTSQDSQKWKEACQKEISALSKTKTFSLVKPPANRKVIPTKWVFTIKDNGIYKARIVVQGFRQVEGIDYQATFAPVIRYDSVRMFLALAVQLGLKVHQMDVVTAFLNSPIDTEVFVKPPPGFDLKPGYIWKLNSALYGLKQSPMLWNNQIKHTLAKIGFSQNKKEFGLYFRRSQTGLCLIALYVDDLLIASPTIEELTEIKNFLKKTYEMKDLGPVDKFLGMNIKQSKNEISLSLEDYIMKKAKEYNFTDICPVYNPLQKHIDYYGESPDFKDITSYQSLVGTLIFISNAVRFDVAHAVHFLSRFLKCPKEVHYKAAKRVFDYIFTTRNKKLIYTRKKQNRITAYSDASYADCPDRKSTYGYVTMYSSGPITWCSKRNSCMVTSSTEAEIVAASEATKEIKWLDQVLSLMGITLKPHLLNIDNTSALKLADHPVHHSDTKHIDVRNLFVREAAEEGLIELSHVRTTEQRADIFTKILPKAQFLKLRDLIFNSNCVDNNQSLG